MFEPSVNFTYYILCLDSLLLPVSKTLKQAQVTETTVMLDPVKVYF